MATAVQLRRGTTTQNNAFTGALGEVSVDTTLDTLRVHDGSTAGGFEITSNAATQTLTNKSLTAPTITGTAVMATLDISGDVDVDGTLETDALTIGGVTLAETISDTVGAMVSSNTESGVAVAYQDGDNTLDFTLAAAQTDITSLLAADIKIGEDDQTKIDFETADEIHFYAANAHQVKLVDGAIVPVTDNDIDLGTASLEFKNAFFDGTVTSDAFAGPLTGNVTGNASGTAATVTGAAQTNITSLGTLTALTVDNLGINGNTITANSGAVNITPAGGSAIVLDGAINVDAGVVTGATSITSTAFVGGLTGNVTGNASGTALTVTQAAQSAITSLGTLTTLTVDNVIINGSTIGHTGDTDLITVSSGVVAVAGEITGTGFTGTLDGILGSGTAAAATVTTLDTSGAVNLNLVTDSTSSTSGALIVDGGVGVAKKLFVGTDLDVDGTANLDVVDIDGAVNMATTALVTGVLTTTATQVATGGITSGSNIVSDTDSTDDLGTNSVRWANLYVDAITATDQITATGFTGTLDGILGSGAAAAATVTTLTATGASTHGSVATEHGAGAIATSFAPITRRSTSNGVITTKIHFDLTALGGKGAAANDVIGLPAGGNAFIGRNVVSSNGIVYKAELACLELAAAASGSATVDIDIATNASGTIAYDGAGGTAKLFNTGGMVAGQELSNITPALTANDYFYLVEGDTAATDGVYNAGQFVLTLYGHAVT